MQKPFKYVSSRYALSKCRISVIFVNQSATYPHFGNKHVYLKKLILPKAFK